MNTVDSILYVRSSPDKLSKSFITVDSSKGTVDAIDHKNKLKSYHLANVYSECPESPHYGSLTDIYTRHFQPLVKSVWSGENVTAMVIQGPEQEVSLFGESFAKKVPENLSKIVGNDKQTSTQSNLFHGIIFCAMEDLMDLKQEDQGIQVQLMVGTTWKQILSNELPELNSHGESSPPQVDIVSLQSLWMSLQSIRGHDNNRSWDSVPIVYDLILTQKKRGRSWIRFIDIIHPCTPLLVQLRTHSENNTKKKNINLCKKIGKVVLDIFYLLLEHSKNRMKRENVHTGSNRKMLKYLFRNVLSGVSQLSVFASIFDIKTPNMYQKDAIRTLKFLSLLTSLSHEKTLLPAIISPISTMSSNLSHSSNLSEYSTSTMRSLPLSVIRRNVDLDILPVSLARMNSKKLHQKVSELDNRSRVMESDYIRFIEKIYDLSIKLQENAQLSKKTSYTGIQEIQKTIQMTRQCEYDLKHNLQLLEKASRVVVKDIIKFRSDIERVDAWIEDISFPNRGKKTSLEIVHGKLTLIKKHFVKLGLGIEETMESQIKKWEAQRKNYDKQEECLQKHTNNAHNSTSECVNKLNDQINCCKKFCSRVIKLPTELGLKRPIHPIKLSKQQKKQLSDYKKYKENHVEDMQKRKKKRRRANKTRG